MRRSASFSRATPITGVLGRAWETSRAVSPLVLSTTMDPAPIRLAVSQAARATASSVPLPTSAGRRT